MAVCERYRSTGTVRLMIEGEEGGGGRGGGRVGAYGYANTSQIPLVIRYIQPCLSCTLQSYSDHCGRKIVQLEHRPLIL